MNPDVVFKSGVSSFLIAEIILLWGIMYTAVLEYEGAHIETMGFVISFVAAGVGSAALLWTLYQLLKWKST